MEVSLEQLLGLDESHLLAYHCPYSGKRVQVHPTVLPFLQQLVDEAHRHQLKITPVSAFRSFERQKCIWNEKWLGRRDALDSEGKRVDVLQLDDEAKFTLITTWSAIPGLSRHHWGTDFDIFDYSAIEQGHQVALVPDEFLPGGPCEKLEAWLTNHCRTAGFFRPYWHHQGRIAPEPWHLSHKQTADSFMQFFLKHQDLAMQKIAKNEIYGSTIIQKSQRKIINDLFLV